MPHDSRSAPNPASTEKKSGIRAVPMDFTPQEVAERLRHLPDLIWMDSALAQPGKGAISILSASPTQVLKGQIDRDWDEVSALLAAHQTPVEEKAPHLPQGGLFGWVGYDGQFSLGLYPHLLAYDHDSRQWWEIGNRLSRAFTEPTRSTGQPGSNLPAPCPVAGSWQWSAARENTSPLETFIRSIWPAPGLPRGRRAQIHLRFTVGSEKSHPAPMPPICIWMAPTSSQPRQKLF